MADVTLTSTMRSNLLLLQKTQSQVEKVQNKLSTGNKVNSALDGPTEFFAAKGLNQRAGDLSRLKDAMGQTVSTIKAADVGITSIESLVDQMRGITTSALSSLGNDASSIATRKALAAQFNTLKDQIDQIAGDSGYGGKNLLAGNGLRVDSTSTSRASVNSITGLSNARTTNVSSVDTYSIRVSGDSAISGNATDITEAEVAHGLVGLKVSGTLSSTQGSFGDVSIEARGSAGQLRTFTVSDGTESRVTQYFDNSQTTEVSTTASTTTVGQTSTVTISGTLEEGDIFSVSVAGKTYEYKVGLDSSGNVESSGQVANQLRSLIRGGTVNTYYSSATGPTQTAITSPGTVIGTTAFDGGASATVTVSGSTITITGDANTDFTVAASTTNAETKRISESFASGSIVSFTIDRTALEAASNGGNGTSTIEKNVNISISATSLSGEVVTRSGDNARGDQKLADGENAFAFSSGTVRLTVEDNTIRQAASAQAAKNVITTQQADANTQNDITVAFNENGTNNITVQSQNVTTDGQGLKIDYAQNNFLDRADIEKAVEGLDNAKLGLRSASQSLSTNLNVVTTRENFTKEFSDVLVEGANKLTLADQNEEGTNLLMLQTRQQLSTISLSLANQQQQSILRLF